MRNRSVLRLLAVLLALVALMAACSSDDDTPAASGDTTPDSSESAGDTTDSGTDPGPDAFPVTVSSGGITTTVESAPEAIVAMSPSATEMLFAIGAGDDVVAVDSFSNFPADAPMTDLSAFDPNVEAIIGFEPDLVVLSGDRNDVVEGLDAVGVPALILPAAATLADTYDQIEILGSLTGRTDDAATVVAELQAEIEELVASVPDRDVPLTYFHELDDTLYSVTSSTFIGEIYALAGLENVADAADPDGESFGYPQLSPEFLVDSDPDLVFLADTKCCGQDAETFAARPGLAELGAVSGGHVIELDDDIASRWGPRIVDFLAVVIEAVHGLDQAA